MPGTLTPWTYQAFLICLLSGGFHGGSLRLPRMFGGLSLLWSLLRVAMPLHVKRRLIRAPFFLLLHSRSCGQSRRDSGSTRRLCLSGVMLSLPFAHREPVGHPE